jgi:hypothetical protein
LLDLVRTYDQTAFPVASVHLTLNQMVTLALFLWAALRLARGTRRIARASA